MNDATKAPELLPCPFCGGDNVGFWKPGSCVVCHACGAEGPVRADHALSHLESDAAWNRREAAAPDLARTALALHQQLADAQAARALVVERAANCLPDCNVWCDSQERPDASWRNGVADAEKHHMAAIRALAPVDGLAEVAKLRAEITEWRENYHVVSQSRAAVRADRDAAEARKNEWIDFCDELAVERDVATTRADAARGVGKKYANIFHAMRAERDALAAKLAAAEARVRARVNPLVFSDFRDGGCVGRPHSFQYFITQDHSGQFWCHHDSSKHDSLAKAQEHAQAHYQTAALTTPAEETKG